MLASCRARARERSHSDAGLATTMAADMMMKKSLNIFDKLIVATSENNDKDYRFSVDQRIDIINNSLFLSINT